jgi:hypothetical protein
MRSRLTLALTFLAGGTVGLSAGQVAKSEPAHHHTQAPVTRPAARFQLDPTATRRGFTVHLPSRKPAPRAPTFTVARVVGGRSVALRHAPGAGVFGYAGPRTEFGSPTRLAVAKQRGRWLGVKTPAVANEELAWVDKRSPALSLERSRVSLRVDLSKRRLTLLDGARAVRRVKVGIGRSSSPTPTGRFAVTDKLPGARYSASYGCCILALSAHQTNLPAGWGGGNRVAIHGTNVASSVGTPSSAGCLHARAEDLGVLMRRVPLGAPVFIRR